MSEELAWRPPASPVNRPAGYPPHPSGIECNTITRHMGFNLGNALKYIWRADLKSGADGAEDLRKAIWYLQDELAKCQDELAKRQVKVART